MDKETKASAEIEQHHRISRQWKARLGVCFAMLILAFIGLLVINWRASFYWDYIRIMVVLYALLSIWLFWYLTRGEHKIVTTTIWHHVLHWVGLIAAIWLVSIFVHSGIMGRTQAGLMTLTLLALTIFLAGVYSDFSFMLIGITLGIFAAGAALMEAYLSVIMIPVIIVAAVIIYLMVHFQRKKAEKRA